jgi:hypothetical protein
MGFQVCKANPIQLSKMFNFEMKGGRGSSERLRSTSGYRNTYEEDRLV